MRNTLCATALILIALVGAGCKKGPDLVGKWKGAGASGGPGLDVEFKADNTFTMGAKLGASALSFGGDYKLDGEKLTLTMKDLQFPGLTPQMIEQAKKSPQFAKPQEATIKFTSDDQATLSGLAASPTAPGGASQSLTLTRVK